MAGLHRVTLNLNPLIGDDGVLELAGVLQDDLWIKGNTSTVCNHIFLCPNTCSYKQVSSPEVVYYSFTLEIIMC